MEKTRPLANAHVETGDIVSTVRVRPLRQIGAIAANTFRESVRDRVHYSLIFFAVALIAASLVVGQLTIVEEEKFIADLGLALTLIVGMVIAIFIGIGLVYKEMERRTIYTLISKPVHRYQLILGKYFGLCLTLLVNVGLMVAGIELALFLVEGRPMGLHWAILPAALLIYLQLALLVSVALLLSSFTTPLLSSLLSFGAFVAGHFTEDLRVSARLSRSQMIRVVLVGVYYLLPNMSDFTYLSEATRGRSLSLNLVASAALYAVVYVSVLLSVTILIFQSRDFK